MTELSGQKWLMWVLAGIAFLAFLLLVYSEIGKPKEQCLTGTFLIPNLEYGGMVAFGEQQLCGKDLRWSGVYGPSIEEWKKGLENKLPKASGR